MRIDELLWDERSEEHIARHGVHPFEVEEAVSDRDARFYRVGAERYAVLGATFAGRYLFVVLQPLGSGLAQVRTARDMSDPEKRRYKRR